MAYVDAADLASNDPGKGAALVGIEGGGDVQVALEGKAPNEAPKRSTTFRTQTVADILAGEPVNAFRFIDSTKHSAIQEKTDTSNLRTDLNLIGDCAADINAAGQGMRVEFPEGLYNIDGGSWYFDQNAQGLEIVGAGMGRTILHQHNATGNALRIASSTTADFCDSLTYYPITANAAKGAMSAALTTPADAANFLPNTFAWIRCRQLINPGLNSPDQPLAELVEILDADTTTGVVRFKFPLVKSYTADTTGTIFTYGLAPATSVGAPIENVRIADMTFNHDGTGYVIWLRHMRNCIIERVQTIGKTGITSSAGSTGFILRECDIALINENADQFLHFLSLDKGAKHALIQNNTFRSTGAGDIHLHEGVADVLLDNNRFMLAPLSATAHNNAWPVISLAGSTFDIRIRRNHFINAPFGAIKGNISWKYGTAPYNETQHAGLKITDNIFDGSFGAQVATGAGTNGIDDNIVQLSSQTDDVEILRNRFSGTVPGGAFQLRCDGEGDKVRIEGNWFSGDISRANNQHFANNTRTGGAEDIGCNPRWVSYGLTNGTGPSVMAATAGQATPSLFFGSDNNPADSVGIYGSGGALRLTTNAEPGVTRGTIRAEVTDAGFNVFTGHTYQLDGVQVVGPRKIGWTPATGVATRTAFDTATVTLPGLAERVKALIDDLHGTAGHGLIGT